MAEKKTTTETAAKKAAAPKKACATKKTCAKKTTPTLYITAENVGFRAGDVYQTLANAEGPLSVKEIAKVAGISEQEVLLGALSLDRRGICSHSNISLPLKHRLGRPPNNVGNCRIDHAPADRNGLPLLW